MAKAAIEVEGLNELTAKLSALEAYAESSVLKEAVKSSVQLIADAAKGMVPEKSGRLKRAIRVRKGKSRKGGVSYLAAASKRWFQGDEFYGAFQEFGWKSGKRKSANRHQIPGEHFMEHAFNETKDAALATFIEKVREGIAAETK